MKTINFKNIIIALGVMLVSVTLNAKNIEKNPGVNKMEFSVLNATTVQINSSLYVNAKETLEIQRSYDNVHFQTVIMVFGEEDKSSAKTIKINDKVKKNSQVYYRVVKIQNDKIIPLTGSAIVEL